MQGAMQATPKPALTVSEKPKAEQDLVDQFLDGSLSNTATSELDNEKKVLIMKLFEILDLMQNNEIDDLQGLKEFLKNYKILTNKIKEDANNQKKSSLDNISKMIEAKVNLFIADGIITSENIDELIGLLFQTEKICNVDESVLLDDKQEIEEETNEYNIPEIDELYKKLIEAIKADDKKKITLYRGRIIRILKRKQNEIDVEYEKISVLQQIKELLDLNQAEKLIDIKNLLSEEGNEEYLGYFPEGINDYNKFKEKFETLYNQKGVKKKKLYKEALKEELKEHGRQLQDRYSKEFLDQKGTIFNTVKMLPNAVSLSVKKWVNEINELREAHSNRRKISEFKDVLRETGKMIGTPVILAGKFVASNWYSLYLLHKGLTTIKEQKAEAEDNNSPTTSSPETPKSEEQTLPSTPAPQTTAPKTIPEQDRVRLRNQEERLMPEQKGKTSESAVEKPDVVEDTNLTAIEDPNNAPARCFDPKYQPKHQHELKPAPTEPPKVETVQDTTDFQMVEEPDSFFVFTVQNGPGIPFIIMPKALAKLLGHKYAGTSDVDMLEPGGKYYISLGDLISKK